MLPNKYLSVWNFCNSPDLHQDTHGSSGASLCTTSLQLAWARHWRESICTSTSTEAPMPQSCPACTNHRFLCGEPWGDPRKAFRPWGQRFGTRCLRACKFPLQPEQASRRGVQMPSTTKIDPLLHLLSLGWSSEVPCIHRGPWQALKVLRKSCKILRGPCNSKDL